MRNDQIFVLLLVVLLPMSGCFDGGGVGEAEGAQDSDEAAGGTGGGDIRGVQLAGGCKHAVGN